MQLGSKGAKIPLPAAGPGQIHVGVPGNSIFTAQKAIDWLIICSIFTSDLVLSEKFFINLCSWNDYDSWFFSFLKNIRSWNFKFDSWITNHESLLQTLPQMVFSCEFCEIFHNYNLFYNNC